MKQSPYIAVLLAACALSACLPASAQISTLDGSRIRQSTLPPTANAPAPANGDTLVYSSGGWGYGGFASLLTTEPANTVLRTGDTSGVPGFSLLDALDIPPLDASKITTGTFTPALLGTGGSNTSGQYLGSDGAYHTLPTPAAPITYTASTPISIDSNNNISIPVANSSQGGYLSASDWVDFHGKANSIRQINTTAPLAGGGTIQQDLTLSISAASESAPGSLSASDKTKLDAYPATPATAYSLPIASSSTLGGVKIGGGVNEAGDGTISVTAASAGAEPYLGVPSTSGYVLSSTTAGVRFWVSPQSGAQGNPGAAGQGYNNRGAWAANTAYNPYDVLTYGGQTYEDSTAFTSGSTFDATKLNLWAAAGAAGSSGTNGTNGTNGVSPTISSVSASGLSSTSAPTATVTSGSGNSYSIAFGIPAGSAGTNGTNGSNGVSPTISSVSASALSSSSSPTATVSSGSNNSYSIAFGIPAGQAGTNGTNGAAGTGYTLGTAYQTAHMNSGATAFSTDSGILNDGTHIAEGGTLNSSWMDYNTPASTATGGLDINQPTGSTANALEADLNGTAQFYVTPAGFVNALAYSVNSSTPPTANVYMPNGARISITGGIANVATSASFTTLAAGNNSITQSGGGDFLITPPTSGAETETLPAVASYPNREYWFYANGAIPAGGSEIIADASGNTLATFTAAGQAAEFISLNGAWVNKLGLLPAATTSVGGLTRDHYSANGTATSFTFSQTAVGSVAIYAGGVLQNAAGANGSAAYSNTQTSATFSAAPSNNTGIDAVYATSTAVGGTPFTPAGVAAPSSVTATHITYTGTNEYPLWEAQYTTAPISGAAVLHRWQFGASSSALYGPDGTASTYYYSTGNTKVGAAFTSGTQYVGVASAPLTSSGTAAGWSAVVTGSLAYAAPASVTTVLLDYQYPTTSDLYAAGSTAFTAATWTSVLPSALSFTTTRANATVLIEVWGGMSVYSATNGNYNVGARLSIDSGASTPFYGGSQAVIGTGYAFGGQTFAGGGVYVYTLTAGTHTVVPQIYIVQSGASPLCRTKTQPNIEPFGVRVIQY